MCPPSDDEPAMLKKATVLVFMSRSLRPDHTQQNEPALLSREVNMLPSVEDKYLDSLTIDHRDQFEGRYTLLAGEIFSMSSMEARDIEAQLPMPKERL